MSEDIKVSDDGAVRIISMHRPDKKNALTQAMYSAMTAALESAQENSVIRCVLLTGSPGAFTAGNDLEDFLSAAQSGNGISRALDFLRALVRSEKPLAAAVDGLAVGIGTTMLMHCDFVAASHGARFAAPFVQLGLVPEAASTLVAPRLMGHRRAFSLLAMGRAIGAQEARDAGLINMIAADSEAEARKAAQEIASLPAEAVAITRRLMRPDPDEIIRRIDEEARHFHARMSSPEAVSAFKAFLERRKS